MVLSGFTGVLRGFTVFVWVLPSFTGFYVLLPNFTGFSLVSLVSGQFYRVLPDLGWFFVIIQGFTFVFSCFFFWSSCIDLPIST